MQKSKYADAIIETLVLAGVVYVACSNPNAAKKISKFYAKKLFKKLVKDDEERNYIAYRNAFYYLRKKGMLKQEYKNGQLYISLTEEGRRKAGKFQIDSLRIPPSRKWDGKWRVLIFDIKNEHKVKREALRGKIKEWGLFQLQKSVWVYPHEMRKEISLLREFFGLKPSELTVMTAEIIENDTKLKKHFKL